MTDLEILEQRLQQGNVQVERIKVKENQVFSLTARELLAACKKNPDHPVAQVYSQAVKFLPPEEEVHVDRIDLEGLLANKQVALEVEQHMDVIDGVEKLVTTERKKLEG